MTRPLRVLIEGIVPESVLAVKGYMPRKYLAELIFFEFGKFDGSQSGRRCQQACKRAANALEQNNKFDV
jgi:hypothetical protein